MFSKNFRIDIEKDIIAKNRIPILIKDATWLKLFGDAGDKLINNARKELEALLEKQKLVETQLKEKSREKESNE